MTASLRSEEDPMILAEIERSNQAMATEAMAEQPRLQRIKKSRAQRASRHPPVWAWLRCPRCRHVQLEVLAWGIIREGMVFKCEECERPTPSEAWGVLMFSGSPLPPMPHQTPHDELAVRLELQR